MQTAQMIALSSFPLAIPASLSSCSSFVFLFSIIKRRFYRPQTVLGFAVKLQMSADKSIDKLCLLFAYVNLPRPHLHIIRAHWRLSRARVVFEDVVYRGRLHTVIATRRKRLNVGSDFRLGRLLAFTTRRPVDCADKLGVFALLIQCVLYDLINCFCLVHTVFWFLSCFVWVWLARPVIKQMRVFYATLFKTALNVCNGLRRRALACIGNLLGKAFDLGCRKLYLDGYGCVIFHGKKRFSRSANCFRFCFC